MSDLISRQAAIKAIDDLPNCYNGYSDTYDKACIIGALEEVPAIEPKRGKWKHHYEILEKTSEYVISASGYECSECGTMFHNQWDFCGNCGAVMEKVDEN